VNIEAVKVSLVGDRDENQDRAGILRRGDAILAVVMDGMGGHAHGEVAAEVALESMLTKFANVKLPVIQTERFISELIFDAHGAVVDAGRHLPSDMMPRATSAVCFIQRERMYWVHVGDSRLYLIRNGELVTRTRDHTHVETLLQQGVITEEEINTHPMRNFVDTCLGGEIDMGTLTESGPQDVQSGDVIMLCSDGIWGGFQDEEIAKILSDTSIDLKDQCEAFAADAVKRCHPFSDNSTVIVLRIK